MDEKITLDLRTLKALGAETRVRILKGLKERRKTQSELAEELGLAVPSIKEHLDALEYAGLVKRIENERKWKYYELSQKGRQIAEPRELRVWFLLALSAAVALGSGWSVLQVFSNASQLASIGASEAPRMLLEDSVNAAVKTTGLQAGAAPMAASPEPATLAMESVAQAALQVPWTELFLLALSLVAVGICVGYLLKKR